MTRLEWHKLSDTTQATPRNSFAPYLPSRSIPLKLLSSKPSALEIALFQPLLPLESGCVCGLLSTLCCLRTSIVYLKPLTVFCEVSHHKDSPSVVIASATLKDNLANGEWACGGKLGPQTQEQWQLQRPRGPRSWKCFGQRYRQSEALLSILSDRVSCSARLPVRRRAGMRVIKRELTFRQVPC